MSEGNKQWGLGLLVGIVLTSLVAISINEIRPANTSEVDMPKDIIQSYTLGLKDALRTNPPSAQLEMTCLEMWSNKK